MTLQFHLFTLHIKLLSFQRKRDLSRLYPFSYLDSILDASQYKFQGKEPRY